MFYLLPILMSLSAWAGVDFKPKRSAFLDICRAHRREAQKFEIESPDVGVETYFPVLALQATQTRFSYKKFLTALKKAAREEPDGFNYDHKRSMYGMKKKTKAVFYRGKLYIVDGHHRALISTYLGAQTIPVRIVGDFSHLEPSAFIHEMEAKGFAYWRDAFGHSTDHVDLCELLDDPNLQLARLLIRRVTVTVTNGHMTLSDSRGAEISIAVKINSDIPFFEFHLADALTRAGVIFDDSRKEEDLTRDELRKYLDILHHEAKKPNSVLKKVLLLDQPADVSELHLEKVVIKHLQEKSCELTLANDDS